jgi:hypothetical protein
METGSERKYLRELLLSWTKWFKLSYFKTLTSQFIFELVFENG